LTPRPALSLQVGLGRAFVAAARRPAVAAVPERAIVLDPAAIDVRLRALADARARPPPGALGEAVAAGVPVRLSGRWQIALEASGVPRSPVGWDRGRSCLSGTLCARRSSCSTAAPCLATCRGSGRPRRR